MKIDVIRHVVFEELNSFAKARCGGRPHPQNTVAPAINEARRRETSQRAFP